MYRARKQIRTRCRPTATTDIEGLETSTVRIKGLIVEVSKLLRDGVDICHDCLEELE